VQIVANDGLNTGNSLFTSLIVPGKAPPRIVISTLLPGQRITTTKQLLLSAFVQGNEDGLIDADSIAWTYDWKSGLFCIGGELITDSQTMMPGLPKITARVCGSAAITGEGSIEISLAVALKSAWLKTGQRAILSNIRKTCSLTQGLVFYLRTFGPCLFLRPGNHSVSSINTLDIAIEHLLALFQTRQFFKNSLTGRSRLQQ